MTDCAYRMWHTFIFIAIVLCVHVYGESIYVSPNGSDANDGLSSDRPLKSLQKAVDLTKGNAYARKDVKIELMGGHYDLNTTLHVSTHQASKVTIRSYNGQEVHITGGRRLPSTSFKSTHDPRIRASARNHVRVVHLPDLGITDYGTLPEYGFHTHPAFALEVFYNGAPLRLARWPNEGFINIVGVPDGSTGTRFKYNSSRPSTWHHEAEPWVYGYWQWSWADRSVKVNQIDAHAQIVTLNKNPQFGLRTGHWPANGDGYSVGFLDQGGYFRFINILSELDEPGEYYVDRQHGDLYVWIPSTDGNVRTTDEIYVSLIDDCISVQTSTHDVTISDVTIEACRHYGIKGRNLRNVNLESLEVRNTGAFNIHIEGDSRDCIVSKSLLHDGNGGVSVTGGSRHSLETSGNDVTDNKIFRYAREGAAGYSAVGIDGVGTLVRHNLIYEGQYTAIRYNGNDHVMEFNHVYNVCVNASDCGALHTGRDWTARGNHIRHNIVHDNPRLVPGADVRGVMLDDQTSSSIITNNVFYNNDVHVNIGGGRDNIVENNVMYNAYSHSMQVDGRGAKHPNDGDLFRHLRAVPYNSTLWTSHYPAMLNFDSQNMSIPEGNQIHRNIVYNTGTQPYIFGMTNWLDNPRLFNVTETGFSMGPCDHFDVTKGDFRVTNSAATWANTVNFVQVPSMADVGPRYGYGPSYKRSTTVTTAPVSSTPKQSCSTHAPLTTSPVPAYLPDGSRDNDMFNVSKEGCWMSVSKCTDHPAAEGTRRDTWGEQNEHAGDSETLCFERAVKEWKYCGSHSNEQVAAIYAPSGATSLAGDGCFMAMYGCPQHGGPADGHAVSTGRLYRDSWAEQHVNAANDEAKCLARALGQWVWCGSSPNHPVTSIYRPTGAIVTAGAGCWIHVEKCQGHPEYRSMFFDAWGAANYNTGTNRAACLHMASYYWYQCGSLTSYPVTAYHRPSTKSFTFP